MTSYLGALMRRTVTLRELEAHAPALRELNLWFRNNIERLDIDIEVFFESQNTYGVRVVNETSADPGIPGVIPIPIDANHNSICKPDRSSSLVYRRTMRFIKGF